MAEGVQRTGDSDRSSFDHRRVEELIDEENDKRSRSDSSLWSNRFDFGVSIVLTG